MAAMSLIAPPPGVLNIFLSSTVKDYEDLRRKVQDALSRRAGCFCFLSEDWVSDYTATVALCQQQVDASGGFMLMLGHWYGSVPPSADKSITHLEFEWAMAKRQAQPGHKIAVFRPQPASLADMELRSRALPLIDKLPPEERKQHPLRLNQFHEQVDDQRHEWRFLQAFSDEHELRELAIVIGLVWNGKTLLAAAQSQAATPSPPAYAKLSDDQLGQIGRNAQYVAVETIIDTLPAPPQAACAAAILVHGKGDLGQRAFLSHIAATLLKDYYPANRTIGRLPVNSDSLAALVAWIARMLLGDAGAGIDTPEQLAVKVGQELQHESLFFALDCIGYLQGGVTFFQQQFWLPFCARLEEQHRQQPFTNQFVALLSDYGGDDSQWGGAVAPFDPKQGARLNLAKLLSIEALTPFEPADMLAWFRRAEVPGNRQKLASLAKRFLENEQGESDPLPPNVFNRLRREAETLWP